MATSNLERLERLIDEMPRKHRARFRRFSEKSWNDDDLLGVIADLLEGGKIVLALEIISDSRLMALAVTLAGRVRKAFLEFVRNLGSREVLGEMMVLINSGQIDTAMAIVENQAVRLGSIIPENYAFAGKEIAEDLQATLRGIRPTVAVSFNAGHPRASQMAQEQALNFVRNVSNEQKDAIRVALSESLARGEGPAKTARTIKESIGLTDKQVQAVNNYRRLLEKGSKQALDRALHDRRFGPRNLKDDKKVDEFFDRITPDQIDKMVERYREKYLTYRTNVISRTESTETLSAANHEAFTQVIDAAGLTEDDVEKKWNSTRDGRTRHSHVVMNEQKVIGLNTDFTSGWGNKLLYPGDKKAPAKDRIQCRCVCSYRLVIPD